MDLVDACGASVKSDAVASDAELRAEKNRHFAEFHANDQFPAGG